MSLTKNKMLTIVKLLSKMDRAQSSILATTFNEALSFLDAKMAAAFNIGDEVFFRSRTGGMIEGIVTKVNRKNLKVRTSAGQNWNVTASLVEKVKS